MFGASKGSTLPSLSRALHAAHLPQHASSVAVYTDSSRGADGCAASAFCPLLPDLSFGSPLPLLASSFTAELSAILRLLTSFRALAPASFTIFCDCKGALLSLESLFSAHPLVRRIQALYHMLDSLGVSVSFCWVPSHVGIPGNERADSLAREASALPAPAPNSLPFMDFVPFARSYIRSQWQSLWDLEVRNKLHAIKPRVGYWASSFHRDRHKEVVLARLRMGHTRHTHGHLMARSPPPRCPQCNTPLTVEHVLSSCRRLLPLLRRHFPALLSVPPAARVSRVLSEGPHFLVQPLFAFLSDARLFNLI